MLKRNITYTNFNDKEVTGIFYFHISKAEWAKKEYGTKGGYAEMMKRIIKTEDFGQLITQFQEIILDAYGIKAEDGEYFEKSDELRLKFSQTPAFDVLFTELATDENAAAVFLQGVFPKDIGLELEKLNAQQNSDILQKIETSTKESEFEKMQRISQALPTGPPPAGPVS